MLQENIKCKKCSESTTEYRCSTRLLVKSATELREFVESRREFLNWMTEQAPNLDIKEIYRTFEELEASLIRLEATVDEQKEITP